MTTKKLYVKMVAILMATSIVCDLIGFGWYGKYPLWSHIGYLWVTWGQIILIVDAFLCVVYMIFLHDGKR